MSTSSNKSKFAILREYIIIYLTFQSNFEYDSEYWSNKKTFNISGGKTGFDDQETKMLTYWSTAFNNICLGMKLGDTTNWIKLNYTAASLHSVIADGVYKPTSIGRNTWKSLLDNSSLQTECNIEGFNSHMSAIKVPGPAVVRIGIITDNMASNCYYCNSRIGFGGGGDKLGMEVNPCGNEAVYIDLDNGEKHLKAFLLYPAAVTHNEEQNLITLKSTGGRQCDVLFTCHEYNSV